MDHKCTKITNNKQEANIKQYPLPTWTPLPIIWHTAASQSYKNWGELSFNSVDMEANNEDQNLSLSSEIFLFLCTQTTQENGQERANLSHKKSKPPIQIPFHQQWRKTWSVRFPHSLHTVQQRRESLPTALFSEASLLQDNRFITTKQGGEVLKKCNKMVLKKFSSFSQAATSFLFNCFIEQCVQMNLFSYVKIIKYASLRH